MIKVKRNLESPKIAKAIQVLKEEKAKSSGSYRKDEVWDALKLVFNNKCYICENSKVTSYNIEHFRPHKDINLDLKFSWENLFLSCAHCNNIKLHNYDNILDCTKVEVDEIIVFRKNGHLAWEESIDIVPLEHGEEIDETVELLRKVYNGTTEMKKLECLNMRKELRIELSKFVDILNEYWEADGEAKEDAKFLIIKNLKSSSPFAAFKRWMIRDNKEKLSEFFKDNSIKISMT